MPNMLRQVAAGLHHILSLGVRSEDIQVVGDSAGGNLVLQLLLHATHPVQDQSIPPLNLDGRKLAGAYLMSPFLVMTPRKTSPSWEMYDGIDRVSADALAGFGYQALLSTIKTVPELLPFLDQSYHLEGWYDGLDGVVERILITAGGHECLKDDIVEVAEAIGKAHSKTRLLVDAKGMHDEPLADYTAGETRVGDLTPVIMEWFTESFKS